LFGQTTLLILATQYVLAGNNNIIIYKFILSVCQTWSLQSHRLRSKKSITSAAEVVISNGAEEVCGGGVAGSLGPGGGVRGPWVKSGPLIRLGGVSIKLLFSSPLTAVGPSAVKSGYSGV